jgi:hypothetical protein
MRRGISQVVLVWVLLFGTECVFTRAQAQAPVPAGTSSRTTGTVKALEGNTVTLHTDGGTDIKIVIEDSTRLLQVALGQKDLKDATAIHVSDVQVGDRMLVRGQPGDDGKSMTAISVIVMKAADVSAKQEHDKEDWRKRGIGGLVNGVDIGTGMITISTGGVGANKVVKVITSKATVIRRYAPDSVKFDDAKPSTLDQIKTGDQLRARGNRSAEGTEFTAEEIVSGTFRSIAGTVTSTDSANQSLSVMDLVTRQNVTLRIDSDSQLHKLPAMIAQRIAMKLKGDSVPGAAPGGGATPAAGAGNAAPPAQGSSPEGARAGGPPDFQQMLARMPGVSLTDLQKGDAVMVVSTVGTADHPPTAITLLSGVEAILTASPNSGRAAMLLSPWNLGGAGAGDAGGGSNP